MNNGAKGSYAQVNGLKLYYEISGAGNPLILPRTTHYKFISLPVLTAAVVSFLDAAML